MRVFFVFWLGERREIRPIHGALVGLQHGLRVGLFTVGQICPLCHPLKPSYAGGPSYIPFREVDSWTWFMIEIGESNGLSVQRARSSSWRINPYRLP